MTQKTGRKWKTAKCGRCGEPHENYSGKLDSEGVEYVVCGVTNKRMNVKCLASSLRDLMFFTQWGEEGIAMGDLDVHTSTTIMPECPVCGKEAILDKGGMVTLLGFIPFRGEDEMVHKHDPNTHTGHWVCPKGHEWREEVGFQCGCGWKGKPWTHRVKILKGDEP